MVTQLRKSCIQLESLLSFREDVLYNYIVLDSKITLESGLD